MEVIAIVFIIMTGILFGMASEGICKWCTYVRKENVFRIDTVRLRDRLIIGGVAAFIVLALFCFYSISYQFFVYACLIYQLILMAYIDIRIMKIPNRIIFVGLFSWILFFTLGTLLHHSFSLFSSFKGLFACAVLVLMNFISNLFYRKDAFGYGDIKLFAVLGLFLGNGLSVFILILTIILSGIGSLIQMAVMKIRSKAKLICIPLGPYILCSVTLYFVILNLFIQMGV